MAHAEASARTVDAAVTAAAAQLGLRADQVDFEVLEDPVPSTFGYIGSPARVRVTPRQAPSGAPTSQRGVEGSKPPESLNEPDPSAQHATTATQVAPATDWPSAAGVSGSPEPATGLDVDNGQVPATDERAEGTVEAAPPREPAGPLPVEPPAATAVAQAAAPAPGTPAAAQASAPGPAPTAAGQVTPLGMTDLGASPTDAADAAPAAAPRERSPRRTYRDEPIEPQMVEEDTERAGDFLEGLLDALDVDGDITTWIDEAGGHIDLEGPDLDILVGPNGETLDALQELTRLAVLRRSKRRVRLLIDINGFRARQRDRLVSVVREAAEQVIRTREDHELQPMTPAERKVVHDAVAAIDGVRTESLGEEPNRRVVIRPE